MKIRLASPMIIDSIVDGPGLRSVIWTQGCPHNCKNCHNPQTHSKYGGYEEDVDNIVSRLKTLKLQRGITISGGEPLEQIDAIIPICKEAKRLKFDVWLYSGYVFEDILKFNNEKFTNIYELLNYIDVIVDGKFEENKKSLSLNFRGSYNQRIIDVNRTLKNNKDVIFVNEYMNCG